MHTFFKTYSVPTRAVVLCQCAGRQCAACQHVQCPGLPQGATACLRRCLLFCKFLLPVPSLITHYARSRQLALIAFRSLISLSCAEVVMVPSGCSLLVRCVVGAGDAREPHREWDSRKAHTAGCNQLRDSSQEV